MPAFQSDGQASMRPSAFTDGNQPHACGAHMGFNEAVFTISSFVVTNKEASMRPSAFTDGNEERTVVERHAKGTASFNEAVGFHRRKPIAMGEELLECPSTETRSGFNEAVGFHRRKHTPRHPVRAVLDHLGASMRPSAFTDGNAKVNRPIKPATGAAGFNEAVGFHRRKRPARTVQRITGRTATSFNEAVGFHRRKLVVPSLTSFSSGALVALGPSDRNDRFNEAVGFHRRKHEPLHIYPGRYARKKST